MPTPSTSTRPPLRRLTVEEYDYLTSERGWSDADLLANNLELPATKSLGRGRFKYQQEDAAGRVTTLPEGSPQPLRQESFGEDVLGALRSATGGWTAGFNDEISGGSAAFENAIRSLLGGGLPSTSSMGAAYTHARDAERLNQASFEQRHPTASRIASIAGAVAPMGLTMGASAPAIAGQAIPTTVQTMAKGYTIGSAYGGLNALGQAEGPLNEQAGAVAEGMQEGGLWGVIPVGGYLGARGVVSAVRSGKEALLIARDALPLLTRYGRHRAMYDIAKNFGKDIQALRAPAPPPPALGPKLPSGVAPSPVVKPPRVAEAEAYLRKNGYGEQMIQRSLYEGFGLGRPPEPPVDVKALGTTAARLMTGQAPDPNDVRKLMQSAPANDVATVVRKGPAPPELPHQQGVGTTVEPIPPKVSSQPVGEPRPISADEYLAITSDPENMEALLLLSLKRLREQGSAGSLVASKTPSVLPNANPVRQSEAWLQRRNEKLGINWPPKTP